MADSTIWSIAPVSIEKMCDPAAFFDLQINGYVGVDFNADELSIEQMSHVCKELEADGVTGILATIITDDLERMAIRIRNLVHARAAVPMAKQLIVGIHLEGPFISELPGYIGAHPADAVRPATVEAIAPLIDAGEGLVRLVTLAPEKDCNSHVTRWLVDRGVVVSAGHCNPSLDELRASIDNGLTMFTHLGNGCPLMLDRHENIIQRVLNLSAHLWICFIADGVHVPFMALRNYIRTVGVERTIVVSDAISAAGLGPGEFTLGHRKVIVDASLATWAADRSHLVGSSNTMPQVFENLKSQLGLSESTARLVTHLNPREAIGIDVTSHAPPKNCYTTRGE